MLTVTVHRLRGPTGSRGGEVIGGRRSRVDATAAIRTYLSDLIIDLNTGSIAHRPTQRRMAGRGNHRWLSREVINNWFGSDGARVPAAVAVVAAGPSCGTPPVPTEARRIALAMLYVSS